jgi:hypothetical protein
MRKRKKRVVLAGFLAAGVMLLIVGGIAFVTLGQQEEPAVPEIPGITVGDEKVRGCVDCHREVIPERDYRLSTKLIKLVKEGNHPDVVASVKNKPDDCLICHSKQAAKSIGTEPFARMMHRIHLVGGADNHFITRYQGECTHCHVLNKETGEFSIKSGQES